MYRILIERREDKIMKVIKLFYVLYKIKLLSPLSIVQLIQSLFMHGMNLMALLSFAAKKNKNKIAITDDIEIIDYQNLYNESMKLAIYLHKNVQIDSSSNVAFLCKNHISLVKSIFATSRVGANLLFLNTEISKHQLDGLLEAHHFDLLIYDEEFARLIEESTFKGSKMRSYHDHFPAVNTVNQIEANEVIHLSRSSSSKLTLFTSGTTGIPKKAVHKPSLLDYLNPFSSFIQRLKILNYQTAYIATPIYHGYGIAVLLLFLTLGKKIIVRHNFQAEQACQLIKDHQVEVVTVVPTMLQRMLEVNNHRLNSLKCIASGGAKLNEKLIIETFKALGPVLYNLYGTSEAGLNFIATPEDLTYSPTTIGRRIGGMEIKLLDSNMNEVEKGNVGQFCIKNSWSMRTLKDGWIQTGDLGYQDQLGYYFLSGRIDDMVISGGINVYPLEVEQVLINHPEVVEVAIIGIDDEDFGQRLMAYVLPKRNSTITEKELFVWLRSRVMRHQLPREIKFIHEMPYTPLGKLDRNKLNKMYEENRI